MSSRQFSLVQYLARWSSEKFGKLNKQIKDTEEKLLEAQKKPISDDSCAECCQHEKHLDELHEKQKAYWYVRSLVSEVRDGDRNIQYFHHKASQWKKRNHVAGLFDIDSVWREEE